ncbi:hypothetical protein GGF43_000346 [Coemansia sp. RSA 2618]|nr:hypothetical protein GGF43_000346 [Coemansia sp. RSA 2618]
MSIVKAEYLDDTGKTSAFSIECATDSGLTCLVGALEAMQSQLNTKLTSLLDAEKAAQTSSSESSTTLSSEQLDQSKRMT